MIRSWRVLAALLLAAAPMNAQTARFVAPSAARVAAVPAIVSAAPLADAPALLAPKLDALPQSAAAATAPPDLAGEPTDAPDGTASPRSFAEELDDLDPADFRQAAAKDAISAPGRRLFDGSGVPASLPPGLYGEALLDRVSSIAANGQTSHNYHDASHYLFSVADNHIRKGVQGVTDAYSGFFIPGVSRESSDYTHRGDPNHDGSRGLHKMNVEHVFLQSFFREEDPAVRADMHNLMATLEQINGMRENLPFGIARGVLIYSNVAGAKSDGRVFEPPDLAKGRVARAMLYFYARYRNEPFFDRGAVAFWNPQVRTLLDWNRRFPPNAEERERNDRVQEFQGNRNPFVDDSGLAERIGVDAMLAGYVRRPETVLTARPAPVKAEFRKTNGHRSDKTRKDNRQSKGRHKQKGNRRSKSRSVHRSSRRR